MRLALFTLSGQSLTWPTRWGHSCFLTRFHYAPHGLIDAPGTGADFIACSAYKFFGPHVGILWGQRNHLERLKPYKVRPAANELPDRWMTGTQNHEGIAGVSAAIKYLASLSGHGSTLREQLNNAYRAISVHETTLGNRFLEGVASLKGFRVIGHKSMNQRVTTFGIVHEAITPLQLSERLAQEGIFTWAGNFYALPLTEALYLEPEGMLRIGFLHYNTIEEVDQSLTTLRRISLSTA